MLFLNLNKTKNIQALSVLFFSKNKKNHLDSSANLKQTKKYTTNSKLKQSYTLKEKIVKKIENVW